MIDNIMLIKIFIITHNKLIGNITMRVKKTYSSEKTFIILLYNRASQSRIINERVINRQAKQKLSTRNRIVNINERLKDNVYIRLE